ncbi:hypothetical protein HU200_054145 [Digitaria exilis]|uniref:Uncharacterized protein n=1 Tax=Digitaria exilis TaxID=1010633 RepID=A0A835AVS2_9POAL|nr:hypothetical protein HU200_054145 [Digitaria exilis]
MISPSSDVEMRRIRMCWNRDDDAIDLLLVQAPEGSWITLCDHDKVLCHLFEPSSGCVSCWALAQVEGAPSGHPNPRAPLFHHKQGSHYLLDGGFA